MDFFMQGPQSSIKFSTPTYESYDILLRKAKDELNIDYLNCYNIAVCGETKNGKSTFINGFLKLKGKAAAKVDVVECTTEIKGYKNPTIPFLMLWDMPGAGTERHPAGTYFRDKKLYAFDCILLITSGTFSEVDTMIAREAKRWNKQIAIVRTKADRDVKDLVERKKFTSMSSAAKHLRQAILYKYKRSVRTFIISCHYFPHLLGTEGNPYYDNKSNDRSLEYMDEHDLIEYVIDSAASRLSEDDSSEDDDSDDEYDEDLAELLDGILSLLSELYE